MIAADQYHIKPVNKDYPTLRRWYYTLLNRIHAHTHELPRGPGVWLGMWDGDTLVAALGSTVCADGTLFVDALVCEPSKRGLFARAALCLTTTKAWHGPIRFSCEVERRSIRRLVQRLGAQPKSVLYEVQGTGDVGVYEGQQRLV